jgi:hypothetical protein
MATLHAVSMNFHIDDDDPEFQFPSSFGSLTAYRVSCRGKPIQAGPKA